MKHRLWIALHALVALLPVAGAILHAPDAELFGVEASTERPALSVSGWRSERVQPALQSWFESHVGFRGVMVRTDTTIQKEVLGEVKPGDNVVLVKDDLPFYKDDLVYMGRRPEDLPAIIARYDDLTTRLGALYRKMHARGRTLVVTVSPSKTEIYPEAVPSRWRRPGNRADLTLHAALIASLERNGVPFTDGAPILASADEKERALMWNPYARHWSMVGACRVLRQALAQTRVAPDCEYVIDHVSSDGNDDYDLRRLENVWHFGRFPARSPRVLLPDQGRSDRLRQGPGGRPRTLLVGTSFLWMLVNTMRPYVDAPIAFFYNRAAVDATEYRELGKIDERSPQWPGWALDRELYILDIFDVLADEDWLPGFVETLSRRLGD